MSSLKKKEICNEEYEPNAILQLRTWTVVAAFLLSPVSFTLLSLEPSKSFLLLKGYEAAGDAV